MVSSNGVDPAAADKFWARVSRGDGCWEWMGGKSPTGYGAVRFAGKSWIAHRLAFHLAFGGIPEGKHILHRCDNPPCCRPDHLYAGTPLENARDRMFNPLPDRELLGMVDGSNGPVTNRQQEIFDFIRSHIDSLGYAPSIREIAAQFKIGSPNGVMCHLKALELKGLISRGGNKSRAIQILQSSKR